MAYKAASHQGAVKVPSLELSFGLKKKKGYFEPIFYCCMYCCENNSLAPPTVHPRELLLPAGQTERNSGGDR